MRYSLFLLCLLHGFSVCAQHWGAAADSGYHALNTQYWSASRQYYQHNNTGNRSFDYWWNAHAADLMVDGYLRTKRNSYIQQLDQLLDGMHRMNGSSWYNDFYDDEQWLALALLRAYEATGHTRYARLADTLWADIQKGWTPVAGGGIMWMKTTPHSKNACSNGPAMIIAARMYRLFKRESDLAMATKIYRWQQAHLINPENGTVWDNVQVKNGEAQVNKNPGMVFTYNQGTWLGGALELYTLTGQPEYLESALRTARFVVRDTVRFSPQGILKGENNGDGGLFKGIFVRYFTQLLLRGKLEAAEKEAFLAWLRNNGRSLLENGTRRPEYLFDTRWCKAPATIGQDASIQMSGIMLLEALHLADGSASRP
ncbi:glycosyl hydrolase family 76 [Chitinophaga lutea]|uniref:Glycosyl hydrolase family 76 n=1 Tax=Chitinophaga lutea TaxID=2488634 RepID=A0A3N4PHZ6_9BACT|nr:glycoside hydrolase family 76 protein [Chitinophaga lutea]RPE08313.1 glycosyl hydrolase family 76 [Chitinophaga lutea]